MFDYTVKWWGSGLLDRKFSGSKTAGAIGILTIFLAAAALISILYLRTSDSGVQLTKGELVSDQWDYSKGRPLELKGEWEVIWGKLVSPGKFDAEYRGDYFSIPNRWNAVDHPAMNGAYGAATFRARLDLPDYEKDLSFHQISPHSAWRIYANGFLIGGNGTVSELPGEHQPHYTSRVFSAYPGKSEIILQVANYTHAFGGPGHPLTIWDTQSLFRTLGLLSLYYVVVLGVLLAIGVFHLIFYLADRRHREQGPVHLWFSLLCFIMVFRISGVIPYFHIYYPEAAYWSDLRFPYFSLFAAPAVYILFFRLLFPDYFPKRLTSAVIAINVLFAMIVLVTPESFYTQLRNFSILMNVFVILYSLLFTSQALLDKQPGSVIVMISNTVFLGAALNDAVIYTDNGNGFDLTPFGVLVLGIGYSYALLLRLQATFRAARQTSTELEKLNLGLEKQVHDRTQEFEAAAAKAENSALDRAQFIAAASHDLRQPLHALALFNHALKNQVRDKKMRELVGKQEASIGNLSNLLQDTLDAARAEISEKEPSWSQFQLDGMLRDVAGRFEMEAAAKEIDLIVEADHGHISSDAQMLQRVLSNLLDNALKAAKSNVVLTAKISDNGWTISVQDDGAGIAQEDIERIFQSYVSLREPDAKDKGGYGLGLHVVKNFVKSLDGQVQVHSARQQGTIFELVLPSQPAGYHPMVPEPEGTHRHSLQAGMAILLIDDEIAVLEAMTALLESWECVVKAARNSEQAIEIMAHEFTPDLLLVDYHLFGENGIDVIQNIRSRFDCEVPAAIVTGATESAILKKIDESGLVLLSKPLDSKFLNELLESVRR
ncbi:ATP-binding protein [Parasphingorhabdus sp.]|uniref:hybrid sensor histidine kinase/response regulator n=1 Tax=Parasphingorhabdus sp. TaxID=2709688 RepID=UPI0032676A9E